MGGRKIRRRAVPLAARAGGEAEPVEDEHERDGVAGSPSAVDGRRDRGAHKIIWVPGGAASSQDWKPISDDGLIASSTSPSGVEQVTTT